MRRSSAGFAVLLGDAAFAVSLIAGKGATLAMAGAAVLADAVAENTGEPEKAFGLEERGSDHVPGPRAPEGGRWC